MNRPLDQLRADLRERHHFFELELIQRRLSEGQHFFTCSNPKCTYWRFETYWWVEPGCYACGEIMKLGVLE